MQHLILASLIQQNGGGAGGRAGYLHRTRFNTLGCPKRPRALAGCVISNGGNQRNTPTCTRRRDRLIAALAAMKFGHAERSERLTGRGKAREPQHRVAIIGPNNQNAAHKGKACGAHRPRSRPKLFQTRRNMRQEMLHGRRGEPSDLRPLIKTPEAHGIFRMRQRPKSGDFLSRHRATLQRKAKHGIR